MPSAVRRRPRARGPDVGHAGPRQPAAAAGWPSATARASWWRWAACCGRACPCAGPPRAFTDAGRRFPAGHAPRARLGARARLQAMARELGFDAPRRSRRCRRLSSCARRASASTSPGCPRWTRAGRASSSSSRPASSTRPSTTATCGPAPCGDRFDVIVLPSTSPPTRCVDRPRRRHAARASTRAGSGPRACRRSRRSRRPAARWSPSDAAARVRDTRLRPRRARRAGRGTAAGERGQPARTPPPTSSARAPSCA